MGFQPIKKMQNYYPPSRRAVWVKIAILAPGRCLNGSKVVQRVKYWYIDLGRVFGILTDVPEAPWSTFGLLSQ